ncbi:MAG: hypothetical protein KBC98_02295 [Candidatus Pacebacteria bacterium]|nr:hypothetical protein [Candidatus Paceibacterota bacterium]
MKNILTCTALVLCTIVGFCQQQLSIPGYAANGYSGYQMGDAFTTTITNNGNEQLCLFARLDGLGDDAQYIFWSDSVRDAWMLSQIDTLAPVNIQRIQAIHAIEKVLKSPFFENRHLVWSGWGSSEQAAKKCSWVGFGHSVYNYQCGDYAYLLLRTLESLGLSTWDELRLNNIGIIQGGEYVGLHTVGEVFSEGAWMKVDPDPGTPRTQEINPASLNGFASVADIVLDTNLVEETVYKWISESGDSVRLTNQTVHQYRQIFAESHPYEFFNEDLETYQVSSIIKIPPGVSMRTHKKEECVLVDVSGYSTDQVDSLIDEYIAMYQAGNIEDVISLLVSRTGLSETVVHAAVVDERVALSPVPYWPGYDRGSELPYVTFHIPSSPDTIFIGRDISAPFLVRRVDLPQGGAMYLDDEFIVSEREYFLFDTSNAAGGVAPVVEDDDVHYFDRGFIVPNTQAVITCCMNPKYYDFWNGITFDILCGDIPIVSEEFTFGPYHVITDVISQGGGNGILYPNPAHCGDSMDVLQDARVFDMTGRELSVSGHAPSVPGAYLVFIKGNHELKEILIVID